MSVCMPITHYFNYCSFLISFEIRTEEISWYIFLMNVLAIRFLWDSIQTLGLLFISAKNIGILIGITQNLYIALGSTGIFTILHLLKHEHGMSFHLFMSALISFTTVLWFFSVQVFPLLGISLLNPLSFCKLWYCEIYIWSSLQFPDVQLVYSLESQKW